MATIINWTRTIFTLGWMFVIATFIEAMFYDKLPSFFYRGSVLSLVIGLMLIFLGVINKINKLEEKINEKN